MVEFNSNNLATSVLNKPAHRYKLFISFKTSPNTLLTSKSVYFLGRIDSFQILEELLVKSIAALTMTVNNYYS